MPGEYHTTEAHPASLEQETRIDFSKKDPVEVIRRLTSGIDVDRAIDAVGVEAETSDSSSNKKQKKAFQKEVEQIAPKQKPVGDNWKPGEAPSQALQWAVASAAMGRRRALQGRSAFDHRGLSTDYRTIPDRDCDE
jgi:threonine dehydrogenase-like Zn-dependent dehydrogenase